MAQIVRKDVIDDKYNTESIKQSLEKKDKKKEKKKVVKSVKTEKNNNKRGFFAWLKYFFSGVASEFKKVHWPSKKDMVKYSIATVFFIIFFGIFFYIIDIIFAFIQSLF